MGLYRKDGERHTELLLVCVSLLRMGVTAYMQLGKCLISGEVAPLNPLTDEQIGNPVNKSKVLGVQKRIKGHHVNFMVSAFGVFMTLLH